MTTEYENVTVWQNGKFVTERRELAPWIFVRVTLADGYTWTTDIRGPIEAVRQYFMQNGGYHTYEDPYSEYEITSKIVSIEEVTPVPPSRIKI